MTDHFTIIISINNSITIQVLQFHVTRSEITSCTRKYTRTICNDWYTIFIFSRHNIPLFSGRIESEIIKRIHTIRHITVHQTNFLAYKNTIVIATGLCATTRKNHFVTIGTIQCIYLILIESNIKIKVKIEIFRLNEICIQRQLYTAISSLTKILVLATITCIRGQLHFHNQVLSNIIIIIKCQIYTITEET